MSKIGCCQKDPKVLPKRIKVLPKRIKVLPKSLYLIFLPLLIK
jgi:hypothetical protein